MDLNLMLFYGGLAAVALSIVSGIIIGLVLMIKSLRLNVCFDTEYGKQE